MAGPAASEETLLVGDSVIDLKTARAADTAVCVARYGFGYEGFPVHQLRESDRVVERPVDLIAVVSEQTH
jgi:phosphoglycolate phosphatase-like HAD superfamily hydrolase